MKLMIAAEYEDTSKKGAYSPYLMKADKAVRKVLLDACKTLGVDEPKKFLEGKADRSVRSLVLAIDKELIKASKAK